MSALLEFRGLGKSFFGVPAVHNVDLSLKTGEILCLVGENGAGKSTLMNMLGGVHQPDDGTMLLNGAPYQPKKPSDATEAGIAFIHQELNLFGNLSIAENILVDRIPRHGALPFVNRGELRRRARAAMEQVGLNLSPDTKVDALAPGEKQLVEIAKALAVDARIIILDEPTTSLTNRETEILFALLSRLREEGRSLIYISHVLADVMRIADQIVVLRDGERIGGGPVSDFDIPKMIATMVGRPLQQLFPARAIAEFGDPVLEVDKLSEPGVVRDISLTVHRGEVVGLYGLMGAGRTELARVLFGLDPHDSGTVRVAGKDLTEASPRKSVRNGLAFVTEDRRHEGLMMDSSILDNMSLVGLRRYVAGGGLISQPDLEGSVRGMGDQLRLKTGDPTLRQPVRSLSGGNQQKVVIGKWVLENPDALIMDEPTRGIDVGAKFEVFTIMNELAAGGAGILYISSEIEELIGVSDRILVMHQGMIVAEFEKKDFSESAILAAAFGRGEAA
jgi:ribose transport system ATP-binding protein